MPADLNATVIPGWAIIFAFTVGAVATVFEIIRFVVYVAKQPHLEVRLTKEIFIRLMEKGECFFCNAAILGRHGPVEIRDVFFVLTRLGESKKTFRLSVTDIGLKQPGPGPIAVPKFYTTSPLEFVVNENAFRPVIIAALDEHRTAIQSVFNRFDDEAYDKRDELRQRSPSSEVEETMIVQEAESFIESHVGKAVNAVGDLVQIEPGKYEIELRVRFIPTRRIFRRQKTTSSKVRFEMGLDYRKAFRRQIRSTLGARARNIIFSQEKVYLYPEFEVLNAKEVVED